MLPPIRTEGLTTAHVDELANKTRCDMLQVLKEISVHVDDRTVPVEAVEPPSSAIGVTEVQQESRKNTSSNVVRGQEGLALQETGPRQRTISVASEETTEDEGAVLVRRPN